MGILTPSSNSEQIICVPCVRFYQLNPLDKSHVCGIVYQGYVGAGARALSFKFTVANFFTNSLVARKLAFQYFDQWICIIIHCVPFFI